MMFSSSLRSIARRSRHTTFPRVSVLRLSTTAQPTTTADILLKDFDPPKPPEKLNLEMARGIVEATHFYVRNGVAKQNLESLAADDKLPIVHKWQRMMQVFLTTQLHVVSGLGYSADEEGLGTYAQHLAQFIQELNDPDVSETFVNQRRSTWRDIVATCFDLNKDDIPILSIVDARSFMHKVSSRMIDPNVLMTVKQATANIKHEDPQMEVALKHQVLQDVIVNTVYLGGSPNLVEESGFGSGSAGYAIAQCAMSDHEGDPLISDYVGSAMIKLWEAAGLDLSSIQPKPPS